MKAGIRKRTVVRDIARMLFAGMGVLQWILFVLGGLHDGMQLIFGGMLMMMAVSNFCSQCPLLSAVKRMLSLKKRKVIVTEKV